MENHFASRCQVLAKTQALYIYIYIHNLYQNIFESIFLYQFMCAQRSLNQFKYVLHYIYIYVYIGSG